MPKHTFGEIPDDYATKGFLPLNPRLYEIFQELGWDHVISKFDDVASQITYDTLKCFHREDSCGQTCNKVQ
ncbi:MAG: hypothetical protein ACTSRB_18445 [Candidatus Helarchaeota archaeon]